MIRAHLSHDFYCRKSPVISAQLSNVQYKYFSVLIRLLLLRNRVASTDPFQDPLDPYGPVGSASFYYFRIRHHGKVDNIDSDPYAPHHSMFSKLPILYLQSFCITFQQNT